MGEGGGGRGRGAGWFCFRASETETHNQIHVPVILFLHPAEPSSFGVLLGQCGSLQLAMPPLAVGHGELSLLISSQATSKAAASYLGHVGLPRWAKAAQPP